MLEIILIVLGLVFIVVDLLLLASGIVSLLGIVSIAAGLYMVYHTSLLVFWILIAAFLLLFIGGCLIVRYAPNSALGRRLTLHFSLNSKKGFVSSSENYSRYLGKEGTALTILRPSGTIDIDGRRIDAVSEGGFITKGSRIRVVGIEGNHVTVKEIN